MRYILSLILLTIAVKSFSFELQPFQLEYTANLDNIPINGTATRDLRQIKNSEWRLTSQASMLIASIEEESIFSIKNNNLIPQSYLKTRQNLGKKKQEGLTFDYKKNIITNSKNEITFKNLNGIIYDKSTYQLALQKDVALGKKEMRYKIIDDDEIDVYHFKVQKEEKINTNLGTLNTIKVTRVRNKNESDRETYLWFAKDWDYTLVKLDQLETNGQNYNLIIDNGRIKNKEIIGN